MNTYCVLRLWLYRVIIHMEMFWVVYLVCVWISFIVENWKYCSKIIFKCVTSAVWPIFNESFAETRDLWVSWTMHKTHWKNIKITEMHFSKKKKKCRRSSFQHYSNRYLETYSQLSVEEYLGVVVKVIEDEPLVASPNKILT